MEFVKHLCNALANLMLMCCFVQSMVATSFDIICVGNKTKYVAFLTPALFVSVVVFNELTTARLSSLRLCVFWFANRN